VCVLWARFGSWENLRDASIVEIEDTIRAVTLSERNVVQLKQALEQITQRCGTLSLDFPDYHTDKIRSWLEDGSAGNGFGDAAIARGMQIDEEAIWPRWHRCDQK
jgi:hypothetical protein